MDVGKHGRNAHVSYFSTLRAPRNSLVRLAGDVAMSKYSFERMSPDEFESMAKALLEKTYRADGELTQFQGGTADGGREATWTQFVGQPAAATNARGR